MRENKNMPTIDAWNSIILETTSRNIFFAPRRSLLGDLCYVYANSNERKNISIRSFYYWMMPAINHEQIKLLQGDLERYPSGYIVWIWVNNKTLNDYLTNSKFVPHLSQWNEGDNLIILDVLLPNPKKSFFKRLTKMKNELKRSGVKNIYYRDPGCQELVYSW